MRKFSADVMEKDVAHSDKKVSLILASSSLQRVELLEQIDVQPAYLHTPSVDETVGFFETPRALSLRLARTKAQKSFLTIEEMEDFGHFVILAADTVVAIGRRILPKAETEDEARYCLNLLSGRTHRVYTAICIMNSDGYIFQKIVETRVRFMKIETNMLEAYLHSHEWQGKAGGYAIQGYAGCFVTKLVGSYSNVVGLPLYETVHLLYKAGYQVQNSWVSL